MNEFTKELNMRFVNGKRNVVTLSYDDGCEQDLKLLDIMEKYGLKGTFNLNSGLFSDKKEEITIEGVNRTRLTIQEAVKAYKSTGNEVAIHGLYHPFYSNIPIDAATYEIVKDRENLEREFGCIVRGSAYPFGSYNDEVVGALKNVGIVYSRTVESSYSIEIPTEWMRLKPTCHHKDPRLMEIVKRVITHKKGNNAHMIYVWGHTFEFDADNNWNVIEEFADYVGNRDDVVFVNPKSGQMLI